MVILNQLIDGLINFKFILLMQFYRSKIIKCVIKHDTFFFRPIDGR